MKYSLRYKLAQFMRARGYDFSESTRPEVVKMQEEIALLENRAINFLIQRYPDGSWVAKSTNIDGLITGGSNISEVNELLKDAIFTYYGISPQFANDKLLRNTGDPITTEQRVHITA